VGSGCSSDCKERARGEFEVSQKGKAYKAKIESENQETPQIFKV